MDNDFLARDSEIKTSSWLHGQLILLMSIKWVPGTPWGLVVKSKLSPHSSSADLEQLNPVHKKEQKDYLFTYTMNQVQNILLHNLMTSQNCIIINIIFILMCFPCLHELNGFLWNTSKNLSLARFLLTSLSLRLLLIT